MPRTSQKQREKVIELKLLNFTVCEISKETRIHKSTVSRIILRYESRGTVEHRKNPGRPKKITEKVERIIVRESKKDPFLSSTEVAKVANVQLAASTIRKILV